MSIMIIVKKSNKKSGELESSKSGVIIILKVLSCQRVIMRITHYEQRLKCTTSELCIIFAIDVSYYLIDKTYAV